MAKTATKKPALKSPVRRTAASLSRPARTESKPEVVGKLIRKKIVDQSVQQLRTSRIFKRARMTQVKENEDLYHGIVEKSIRNPFNECFPFMAGYIDHLRSKIDDDSSLSYGHTAESDLKRTNKLQAMYDKVSKSIEPNDSWDIKHRHAKYNALFSGRAIYKFYCERTPKFSSNLDVISHYDFHCEPRGGAIIENHLFVGQDNIFKNKEDLRDNPLYDQEQVVSLFTNKNGGADYKENNDVDASRNNRYSAMGQDPVTNNYVGQDVVKLVEWYTTYKGKRYYVLFNEQTNIAIRVCRLKDIFPDELWPYLSWATNEDPDLFWSKAPADDARPVAKNINTFLNQELYNRQKRNYGQRGYDAEMFPNVASLADWRPDGLIPVNTFGGQRKINEGVYEFKVGDLNGTLDLVTWIEQFVGKQIGYTASSAGQAEQDKKVGVFEGEVQQSEQLIGVKNKSYRNFLSLLGLHFQQGVENNLTEPEAIEVMGAKGVEWDELTPKDLEFERPLKIQPIGGTSELQLKRVQDQEKFAVLEDLSGNPNSGVNPQWVSREKLLLKGYTEDQIKDAFSQDSFATRELMSEAAQAEKDIVEGEMPKLNRGANAAFMQHIVDFATDTEGLDLETHNKLIEYAMAHTDIATENEARNIKDIIRKRRMSIMGGDVKGTNPDAMGKPTPSATLSTPNAQPTAGMV